MCFPQHAWQLLLALSNDMVTKQIGQSSKGGDTLKRSPYPKKINCWLDLMSLVHDLVNTSVNMPLLNENNDVSIPALWTTSWLLIIQFLRLLMLVSRHCFLVNDSFAFFFPKSLQIFICTNNSDFEVDCRWLCWTPNNKNEKENH